VLGVGRKAAWRATCWPCTRTLNGETDGVANAACSRCYVTRSYIHTGPWPNDLSGGDHKHTYLSVGIGK
jgi:hypothetical protein